MSCTCILVCNHVLPFHTHLADCICLLRKKNTMSSSQDSNIVLRILVMYMYKLLINTFNLHIKGCVASVQIPLYLPFGLLRLTNSLPTVYTCTHIVNNLQPLSSLCLHRHTSLMGQDNYTHILTLNDNMIWC